MDKFHAALGIIRVAITSHYINERAAKMLARAEWTAGHICGPSCWVDAKQTLDLSPPKGSMGTNHVAEDVLGNAPLRLFGGLEDPADNAIITSRRC